MADPSHPEPAQNAESSDHSTHPRPAVDGHEPTVNGLEDSSDGDVIQSLDNPGHHSSGDHTQPTAEDTSPPQYERKAILSSVSSGPLPLRSPITAGFSRTAASTTHYSQDQTASGYFTTRPLHSPSSRKSLRLPNASTQSSSGSLHTLAEQEDLELDPPKTPARASSVRVTTSPNAARRHSKSASISQPVSGLRLHAVEDGHPGYPAQSLSVLSPETSLSTRPHYLRSRSSHPPQTLLYSDVAASSKILKDKFAPAHLARTADNTPMTSPGLFSPVATGPTSYPDADMQRSASPQLHHLQIPKETHNVEIDHDMMTGNKMINSYEVIKELGRGEHGKVKLGRDNANDLYVAIKIVPRFSKQRRLKWLGEPQDQTKREVAILKRARHPNVVSLIEVIDDPNKNKVYLVLEYVEHGEIKWRKTGVSAITKINNTRFDSERKGVSLTLEPSEHDRWLVHTAALKHDALQRSRRHQPHVSSVPHYSAEYDIEEEGNSLERSVSHAPSLTHSARPSDSWTPSRSHSQDDYGLSYSHSLAGSMYGPYIDDQAYKPERKYSVATALSHMSSEYEFEHEDNELCYVPALTQDEARRAFRDTLLGLEFLHAIGIIHRDIKPSNLLVAVDGAVKISDFGVSYFGQPITEEEAEAKDRVLENDAKPIDDERELARSVGTPGFWAPELCYEDPDVFADGKPPKITGAIDVWALGVTLYAMVYARLPFYATDHVGLHAAVCTTDPVIPRTRLVPVDTTTSEFATETTYSINSNKRLDYELKFETVPDSLRDLIRKLLNREPTQRITISQAKKHPWVLENIEDAGQFLEPPTVIVQGGESKITEPDEKAIKEAVVKRSFLGEVARVTTRALGSLFKAPVTGRRRGASTSTNTAASTSSESVNSPAGSTTSTIGKHDRGRDMRRTSLPPDELLAALHKSREHSGHPLAQSQTASPDNEEFKTYFTSDTPKSTLSVQASPSLKADPEARPKLPDRGLSVLSAAESVRTVRANQGSSNSLEVPKEHEISQGLDAALRAKVETFWEGTTRTLTRLASRDRRHRDGSRSLSRSRASSESEQRSAPSLGFSHTQASGWMEAPDALQRFNTSVEQSPLAETSDSISGHTSEQLHPAPTSTAAAFSQAQEINHRRHIQEAQREAEDAATSTEVETLSSPAECPPSPDDLRWQPSSEHRDVEHKPEEYHHMESGRTLSTAPSSVEDFTNSSVTQSTSNPSFVATSGASSPPEETFLSAEYAEHYRKDPAIMETEPDFMRTADTVIEHGRPSAPSATAKSLEQQQNSYYDEDGDDEESSDEDDMVMMGGPKKTKT